MWRRQEEGAFSEAGSSAAALFLAVCAATNSWLQLPCVYSARTCLSFLSCARILSRIRAQSSSSYER